MAIQSSVWQLNNSSYREGYLTYSYSRTAQIEFGPTTATTTDGDPSYILLARSDPTMLHVGQIDDYDPFNENFRASVKGIAFGAFDQNSTSLMNFTADYEGSTGKVLWSQGGSVTAMPWNFDKDGNLVRVPYNWTASASAVAGNTDTGYRPVAHMTRRVPLGSLDATFYVNGSNTGNTLKQSLLGQVNRYAWKIHLTSNFGGIAVGDYNFFRRTMMCARVQNTTENGTLYRIQLSFLEMPELTWDELSLYVDSQNKKLPGTQKIAPVDKYGLDDVTQGNGWIRTRLQGEVDFNKFLSTSDVPL